MEGQVARYIQARLALNRAPLEGEECEAAKLEFSNAYEGIQEIDRNISLYKILDEAAELISDQFMSA